MINRQKIGLGTVQFGLAYGIANVNGQTKVREVTEILALAKKYGIKILDSASAYGNAEEVIGNNTLNDFKIVSKFIAPKNQAVNVQLENSLKNLGVKQLYGYLAHRPMELLEYPTQWKELLEFKEHGKVQKIGFSLNEPEELEKLLKKNYIPDLVQVPFNYFDNRFEESLVYLKSIGCEIHTRSSFLQGLFFMKPELLSSYFSEIKENLRELQLLQEDLSVSLLRFVLDKSYIDKVIIGVENSKQLKQNIEGLKNAKELPILNKDISRQILNPSLWKK
ncbi:aryl-alcohol dehydrogenase-like predicted oxidoreductase [Gillisia sp. Hel_I_86]|uniref:aldo/keto reductase n=1 Tax=Gillisia sp. Hel_I_86 TaxID=1249981 RepID=UPI00119BE33E|nr:aldo/keto reductase [Gillisia sp. Hel_I_86]TVZ28218.1 aryl-alcohol dehydrogenase-like predicted oxidoreductase [Gillisia sp. Hel_I_86]